MSRFTVYNNIVTPEKKAEINKENIELMEDFLEYLKSVDRSPQTIAAYRNDLYIFFTIVLTDMNNIKFTDISKRQFARFQSKCINEFGWSPKRVRRVKSCISSYALITDCPLRLICFVYILLFAVSGKQNILPSKSIGDALTSSIDDTGRPFKKKSC